MSETARVGPVIFAHGKARKQLLEHGHVVTYRTGDERTTGYTHWRTKRTGKGQGKVHLSHLSEIDPWSERGVELLTQHADEAGFESDTDWMQAVCDLNGGEEPGHLYRAVHTLEPEHERVYTEGPGVREAQAPPFWCPFCTAVCTDDVYEHTHEHMDVAPYSADVSANFVPMPARFGDGE